MNQAQRKLVGVPLGLDPIDEENRVTAWLREHGRERGREWVEAYYSICPGCGAVQPTIKTTMLWNCPRCSAVLGIALTWLASTEAVRNEWAEGDVDGDSAVYYDISWPDATGQSFSGYARRHGWFDPITRKVMQTG